VDGKIPKQIKTHTIFIDLEKGCNQVSREVMEKVLGKKGVY